MKWWVKLVRLRKQNDVVKVMLLFLALGFVFLGNAIYSGVHLYSIVMMPAEYVGMADGLTDTKISEIEKLENVVSVSKQIDGSVAVLYNGTEASISFTKLSKEFVETTYGIKDNGTMKTFYMNKVAYNKFKQSIRYKYNRQYATDSATSKDEDIRINYVLDEQTQQSESGNPGAVDYGTAKVVLVDIGLDDDEPYVFCVGNSLELKTNATGVRVRVGQQDLDGMNIKRLQNAGFYVMNDAGIKDAEHQQEIQVLKVKFHALLAAICIISVAMLGKYGKINRRL